MFSLWCMDWVGSLYANRFFFMYYCIKSSIGSGPRVKLASFKNALTPPPHTHTHRWFTLLTDSSEAVVPVLVSLFGALWFILRSDLLYVLPCAILFLCFSVLFALRLPRLEKRELILVLFVCLIDLCLFGFVGFLFPLMSGKGCGLWLWHSLDFLLPFLFLPSFWKNVSEAKVCPFRRFIRGLLWGNLTEKKFSP